MKKLITLLAVLGMVFAWAPAAQAQVSLPDPGVPYRLVFVTSVKPSGVTQTMAAMNAWVTGLAEAVTELDALGTTWSVIGATLNVDVLTNTGMTLTGGVPIYLVDGTLFATNYAKFWSNDITSVPKTPPGDQDYTLYLDELGDPHGDPVQTGLTTNGSDTNPMTFAGNELDSTGGTIVHGGADSGYNNATYPWYAGNSGDTWFGNWGDTRLFAISGVIGGAPPLPTGMLMFVK